MSDFSEASPIMRDENINMEQLLTASQRIKSQETTDIEDATHGDIVTLEDGESGIVIEKDHEAKKFLENTRNKKLDTLVDESVPMYEKLSGEADKSAKDLGMKVVAKDPTSEDALSILNVKRAFEGFEPSMVGLRPANSEEAIAFESAKEALRSGEVVLPTVDQYMEQKRMIEERKKKEEEAKMQEQNKTNVQPSPQNNNASKVVNVAEMEEFYNQKSATAQSQNNQMKQQPESAQNMIPKEVARFQVPEGRVSEFIETLTPEQQAKVETSKSIHVEEVRKVEVPVATRTITSIDQYKRIAKKHVTSEAVEIPLLNSGYVAVVKGCGSLEMASILPDPDTMEWDDYAKVYQFCFNNLVSTSIGTLSYRDFCVKTSPYDLDSMVHAILRASQPDEQSITLTCGGVNCGKDYDIKYLLTQLPDWDSVTDDVLKRIDELIRVKDIVEDAKEVQENSPVMIRKYVDIGDGKTVCIKNPNGPMIIERTNAELIEKISAKTNPIVTLFLLNVEKITLELPDENGEIQVFDLVNPEVIAEEIQTFSDTQLEIVKSELQELKLYPQYTYSFKGLNGKELVCPHCGLKEKRVPCKVQQLVFQRVSRAMN